MTIQNFTGRSLWFCAGLAAIFAVAGIVQFPFSLNHDAAWHFYTALRFLAGDRIGLDIADINPPMALWLFSLPGMVVAEWGVLPSLVFRIFVFLVAGLVLWLFGCILPRLELQRTSSLLLILAAAFLLIPGYHFGQREHLVAMMVLPYVGLVCLRVSGRPVSKRLAILAAALAAIGICFKPYFLAVPLLVELWLAFRRRSLRPLLRLETLVMVAIGMIYLCAVAIFAPDYMFRVVPEAMATYSGFESDPLSILKEASIGLTFPFVAFCLSILARRQLEPLAAVFLVTAAGFLLAALMQQKGWAYQILPTALFVVAAASVQLSQARRFRVPALFGVALCLLMPVLGNLRDSLALDGTTARVAALKSVLDDPGIASVYGFITSPRDMHPAVLDSGKRWADAHGVMIFLPAHLEAISADVSTAKGENAVKISEAYLDGLLARFLQEPPGLLAFDRAPFKLGIRNSDQFDYLGFMARYPRFEALLARYVEVEPVGRFRIFRISSSQ